MKAFIEWLLFLFVGKTETKEETPVKVEVPTPTNINVSNKFKNWDFTFADISHHEPKFVASEYDKPILINKCSDGTTFVDKTHHGRKKDCAENGILYGGYHFFQCYSDPIAQAEHYVKTHGSFDLLPIVDYEKDKNQFENDLLAEKEKLFKCLVHIEKLTGKTPIIYSYKSLLELLKFDEKFAKYPLWIARYNQTLGPIPKPWKESQVVAWQYSDGDYVHIQYPEAYKSIGNCDGNIYFKDNDLLKVLS